jgi:hypothetical protein
MSLFDQMMQELSEKDMIIDAMAQYIDNLNYIDDIECEFETRHNLKCPGVKKNMSCQDCIKQYYERKIENE